MDDLVRFYGRMNQRALTLIRRLLVPALIAEDPGAIAAALEAIDRALAEEFSDGVIRTRAQRSATQINNRHRGLFFSGLAAAAGLRILGTDDPRAATGGAGRGGGGPGSRGSSGSRGPRVVVRLNFNPTILTDQFVDENVRYVSTLRRGIVEALGDQVTREVILGGAVTGEAPVELSRQELTQRLLIQWEEQGVPALIPTRRIKRDGTPVMVRVENHAALIARDQVSKLNGQLNRARQTAAGITSFVWETREDDRVRPEHRELQGRTFTWDEGAGGVYPGEPIQCRCWARAVVDRDQVLSSGDFIPVDNPDAFTQRHAPGLQPIAPGPGAVQPETGPFS